MGKGRESDRTARDRQCFVQSPLAVVGAGGAKECGGRIAVVLVSWRAQAEKSVFAPPISCRESFRKNAVFSFRAESCLPDRGQGFTLNGCTGPCECCRDARCEARRRSRGKHD
eukprot:scaffold17011_cov135-Isochrysis_galbana.AAC.1